MNCEEVILKLGFSCQGIGGETLRINSPFTYAGDGGRIGFYIEKTLSGLRITDGCEAMMQAAAMGSNITQSRVNSVRRAVGSFDYLSDDGEISALVEEKDLGSAMAAVLNTALAVSHLHLEWKPRMRSDTFLKNVESVLENTLGGRVLKKVTITGASGHQLELPLAVRSGLSLIYVQPVASTEENTVDWKRVYEAWGRMSDIKNGADEYAQRLVVLEESANDPEMKSAASLLADSSAVVRYSKLKSWAEERRLA